MIGFTCLAVQVLLWQSADISVSIVSETDDGDSEVTISVLNTAGSTLLFYENSELSGKIEYLSENGWVEYCDVCYTSGNADAVSLQYGGKFAELEPGENWNVTVPDDKIAGMRDGTYRIKMTYVTEKRYNEYLETAFRDREISVEVSEGSLDESEQEISSDFENGLAELEGIVIKEESGAETEEEFLAFLESEVFIKTFDYEAPDDYVGTISIDDSDLEISEKRSKYQRKKVFEY